MTTPTKLAILAAVLLLIAGYVFYGHARAAAPMGLSATLATSSFPVAGPTSIITLFKPDTCSSRVITTYANPIMLSFGALTSTTPSGTAGHLQAASTTIAYDAGIYGCGLWSAWGYLASTTIDVSEFQ